MAAEGTGNWRQKAETLATGRTAKALELKWARHGTAGAGKRKPSSSHRGVSWAKGKWVAKIGIGGGKQKTLGLFEDEEEAAAAYRRAAAERDA